MLKGILGLLTLVGTQPGKDFENQHATYETQSKPKLRNNLKAKQVAKSKRVSKRRTRRKLYGR